MTPKLDQEGRDPEGTGTVPEALAQGGLAHTGPPSPVPDRHRPASAQESARSSEWSSPVQQWDNRLEDQPAIERREVLTHAR